VLLNVDLVLFNVYLVLFNVDLVLFNVDLGFAYLPNSCHMSKIMQISNLCSGLFTCLL